jgi:hypothetical protein
MPTVLSQAHALFTPCLTDLTTPILVCTLVLLVTRAVMPMMKKKFECIQLYLHILLV